MSLAAARRERTIIYVTGCAFWCNWTGLDRRTQLTFSALSTLAVDRRILFAPDEPGVREICESGGWEFLPLERERGLPPRVGARLSRYLARWSMTFSARFSLAARTRLIGALTGSNVFITPTLADNLRRFPYATVWLARSDLLHLAPILSANKSIILDANDSVAHLVHTYDFSRVLRRLAMYGRAGFHRLLADHELRLTRRCSLVVGISPSDVEYFRRSGAPTVLEESCVTAPADETLPPYEFHGGFIGGRHNGAVAAGRNFLRIAGRRELQSLEFAIAGGVVSALSPIATPPNVRLIPKVQDATRFLRSCRQIVLWSDIETGTSVKFQEAILSGRTVLANERASRWSEARPGRDYVLCRSEEEISRHLIENTCLDTAGFVRQFQATRVHARFTSLLS